MRSFSSPGEFAAFLGAALLRRSEVSRAALEAGIRVPIDEARGMPGTYQGGDEAGGFPDWQPLSPATLGGFGRLPGKVADGFAPPDNPLRRTGAMEESYQYELDGDNRAVGGSPDPVAKFQELGTERRGVPFIKGATTEEGDGIPARSVLARAAFRTSEQAATAAARKILGIFTDNLANEE